MKQPRLFVDEERDGFVICWELWQGDRDGWEIGATLGDVEVTAEEVEKAVAAATTPEALRDVEHDVATLAALTYARTLPDGAYRYVVNSAITFHYHKNASRAAALARAKVKALRESAKALGKKTRAKT